MRRCWHILLHPKLLLEFQTGSGRALTWCTCGGYSPEANAAQHSMGLGGVGIGPGASPAAAADTNLLLHRAVWGFMAIASAAANGYVTEELLRLAELGAGPSLAQSRS
jgi:hypothetical protein